MAYMTPAKRHRINTRAETLTAKLRLPVALFDNGPAVDGPGFRVSVTTRRQYVCFLVDLGYWNKFWCPAIDRASTKEDERHAFGSFGPFHLDLRYPAPGGDLRRDELRYRLMSRF